MTKKHFIALADIIRSTNSSFGEEERGAFGFSDGAINSLADFCQQRDPNFNRQRWLAYINGECGKNGDKVKRSTEEV